MVNERPRQFGGIQRFGAAPRPGNAHQPQGSASPAASRATKLGLGLGKGAQGLGKAKGLKRHTKIRRDNIYGVTKGDIRRLARRGGVKRISATLYDDVRYALKERLTSILKDVVTIVELGARKTVTITDIIFVLNRQGRTLYGFDPSFTGRR
ncbi:histone-fold-containing protein [Cucurbitaria berberidis CBS 394.84]|uniref:Histone H4 n=1 Tax=Cucurbitaria berberidis CBS 394.84 TaxID=1168544 RepID=A0A9P4L9Z4_9PLEO|nr:histone-fold-containing protein [Cucurbitaria berberidis CBS 394.84]KAF1846709.1 histone-fold-containing protein [Cucurbitaria berberidis CBS 394.84]